MTETKTTPNKKIETDNYEFNITQRTVDRSQRIIWNDVRQSTISLNERSSNDTRSDID